MTDSHRPACHPPGMDLSKMTTAEVEALLRLQADWVGEEHTLLMLKRWKAEWEVRLH